MVWFFPDLYVIFRYMRWSYCAKVTYNYPYFPHVRTFETQNSGSRFMHIIQKTRRFFYTYTKCTISSQIQTFIPFSGSTCILCNDFCTQNEYRFSKNYRRASIVTVMWTFRTVASRVPKRRSGSGTAFLFGSHDEQHVFSAPPRRAQSVDYARQPF